MRTLISRSNRRLLHSMLFSILQQRLLDELGRRIRAGEFTESGLARRLGASQPHIHNALKGVRSLSIALTDDIMLELNIPLSELLTRSEIEDLTRRKSGTRTQRRAISS